MLDRVLIAIIGIACAVIAVPVPDKRGAEGNVLYDQRQEGEWNVRADLDNFLILIIPTQTASSTATPSSHNLLDFLTKSLPKGAHLKRVKNVKKQHPDAAQETMHFIESKTAPYHVDISESNLQITPTSESSLMVRSPTVTLNKSEFPLVNHRSARTFVLTVPEEEFVVSKTEDKKKVVKKDGRKKSTKDGPRQTLILLGAENEQCGPGMARDSYGICRTYKKGL